ncbi:MAG: dihydroorotate dehydrogenase electron transfer subunit [Clostridia bacterium]
MMKQLKMTVLSNREVGLNTYEMKLQGATTLKSGQFVELLLPNHYLRRPFSVGFYKNNILTILYKVLGEGTLDMTLIKPNETLDVLSELGNSFDKTNVKSPLLIGGGIGAAPLFNLANDFFESGITPTVVLGFKTKSEIFYLEKFKKISNVIVATDDGSFGIKGNAVDAVTQSDLSYDKYYACGVMPMLKGIQKTLGNNGELSLEARMGCGFGACMGCSIQTTKGNRRVCKEGAIFNAAEVIF